MVFQLIIQVKAVIVPVRSGRAQSEAVVARREPAVLLHSTLRKSKSRLKVLNSRLRVTVNDGYHYGDNVCIKNMPFLYKLCVLKYLILFNLAFGQRVLHE